MVAEESERICKFHNTGFCKYKENFSYFHAQKNCSQSPCKKKSVKQTPKSLQVPKLMQKKKFMYV